jgi:hypothetical protein
VTRATNGTEGFEHLIATSVLLPGRLSLGRPFLFFSGELRTLSDEMDLLAVLQHDIAERLRPVCGSMPEIDFQQLVRDIAAVKLKYGVEAELSAAFRERLTSAIEERPNHSIAEQIS